MANLSDTIRQIRYLVFDRNPPAAGGTPVYSDQYYVDAINWSLKKLNFDLVDCLKFIPLPPWTVASLPSILDFLLIKLACIQLCQMRGAEDTVGINGVLADGEVKHISVPDLTVIEHDKASGDYIGAAYWYRRAKELQNEYDGEIERFVPSETRWLGAGMSMYCTTMNTRTGGMQNYEYDAPLTAPTLSLAYTNNKLVANWTKSASEYFYSYTLVKVISADEEETVFIIYDNQIITNTLDLVLGSGTHTYKMYLTNANDLASESNEVDIVVS